MDNKYIKAIIICAVIVVLGMIFQNMGGSEGVEIPYVIETEDQLYEVIVSNLLQYNKEMTCRISYNFGGLDYNRVVFSVMDQNYITGCMLGALSYTYVPQSDGTTQVHIKMQGGNPNRAVKLQNRVKEIADVVRDYPDDYSKVKAIHDYLVLSTKYVLSGYGAYHALFHGECACNGYAASFFLLMDELDIPVTIETGGNHAWNRVYVDGEWYNIDVTWDDNNGISYDYFLKCDSEWRGHVAGGATAQHSLEPVGNSAEQNYAMFPHYQTRKLMLKVGILLFLLVCLFGYMKFTTCRRERSWKRMEENDYSYHAGQE